MAKERYLNTKYDVKEEYKDEIRLERLAQRLEEPPLREREIREIFTPVKRAMPRMEDSRIEPLKLVSPKIVGSLFDRVDFLKTRMQELMEQVKVREQLHKETIMDIDADMAEKQSMMGKVTDIDEIRNFKLDISILRKEKRQESMLYWKDMMELKRELGELAEKFQTESKILKIFENLRGEQEYGSTA